jgi:beta-glucosidase
VGFEKVYLDPNEKKGVDIKLKAKNLAFYDKNSHSWIIEPGDYKLLVGISSRDIQFEDSFEII